MRLKSGIMTICISLLMVFAMMPMNTFQTYAANADSTTTGLVEDGVLDGVKVRIRPTGSFKPLSINEDGSGSQNCVHLYYQGKSSQFYLEKADADSYYIYFYQNYYDDAPKTTGDCRLDLEDDGGYDKEGQIIHVVSGNATAQNKRWQFIRQDDGSYYIRNKKTQKYWTLQDVANDPDKMFKNNTKLVQSSTPLKWDIEIVSKNNTQFQNKVQYDSRNFQYNEKTVSSNNWMSMLPGDLKITDISIPGTHDVGSCRLHKEQGGLSTQRYYIDEMLNAGVRHLDLRTGLNGDTVRIVHSDAHARNHEGVDLTLEETMGWIIAFLEKNPGETVILQPKMDKEGGKCDYLTYSKLREYAVGKGRYIWAGDHVPTLGEVRGKILVLSRLNTDNDHIDFDYNMPGSNLQWALDLDHWNNSGGAESEDRAAAHTASGSNYDVWVQDNYKHEADDKKDYIEKTLYGNKGDGYTNGTQYHYDQSKMNGKDAWILNYTSASHKSDIVWDNYTPYDLAKEIQQWMLDRSDDYDRKDERIISSDTFTGIMAFDFMDGLLSTFIYKTNFKRDYVTVHGVDVSGEEVANPLVLQIGENERTNKILSGTTKRILEGQFNNVKYELIPSDNGYYLAIDKATTQEGLDNVADEFYNNANDGNVPANPYVHLRTSITEFGINVDMPKCGTTVSGDDPQVSVIPGDITNCKVESAYITQNAGSEAAFEGTVEGGATVPIRIEIAPKWGYWFETSCVVTSDTALITSSSVSNGVITIKAEAAVSHDLSEVEGEEASCEENGVIPHYICKNCGQRLMEKKTGEGEEDQVLLEVDESEVTIPALGHTWGEWIQTKDPTEDSSGELTRTCGNDETHKETLVIPKLEHTHVNVIHMPAYDAENCTETGNIEYWKCEDCGCFFSDKELTVQIKEEDVRTTVGEHSWGDVRYLQGMQGSTIVVTAICECEHDTSHAVAETVPATVDRLEATCTEAGHLKVSAQFGNELLGKYTAEDIIYEPLDHAWDNGIVIKAATCSAEGERVFTCERCDETKTEKIPIDENAHDTFIDLDDSSNNATCTESGRANQFEVCSICDKVISQSRPKTSPLGHDWGAPVYQWSGDMSEVTATRTCTRGRCGETETETVKTTTRIMEACSCETAGMIKYDAQFESEAFDTQEKAIEVEALGHDWGEWTITKEATATSSGEKQRVCKRDPSHIEKQTIPAEGYAPGTDPNQKGTDGTAVGPGASAASADKAITGMTNDKDPKGSVYNKVKLRSTKQTKTAITLKWTKPSGAAKFVLYGNMCGTKNKMTKIGTYTGSSKKLTKVAGKNVKKGTYYKFILVALDKNNNVVSTSKVIHIATKGGKVTNPKKVIVKKGKKAVSKVTVKNSKTITVKTTVTKAAKKLKLKTHRKVMYESSNTKIATVTSKGKIKGVKKGTCYIYAYAQNGVYKKIKVTVN